MPPRLRLLGALEVESDEGVQPIGLDRPTSLLVYLAVRDGWVSRGELAFLYRPDEPEAAALRYLRKLVFRARQLPWADGLEVDERGLRWEVESDVRSFRKAVEEGDGSRAVACYAGPFLAGVSIGGAPGFDIWQESQRSELETIWRSVAAEEATRLLEAGMPSRAVHLLERLHRSDPFDEGALQAYARALVDCGRRRQAAQVVDRFRAVLLAELGAHPLESTQALADSLRVENESRPAANRKVVLPAPPPVPATRFVGREREIEELIELIRGDDARLVTLVGLGGSGKTRLAVEASARVASHFANGVAYVSFADCPSADAAPHHLVNRLALSWAGGEAEEALVHGLNGLELLLVLDDFERVVAAAPLLSRLLASAPGLRLLVASREALDLPEEWIVDVCGLAVPPRNHPSGLEGFDSVRLFIQRAARVDPGFTPSGRNLRAIGEICRRVEGLPLAIELAASWTRALDCETLCSELFSNARLLAPRGGTAGRHSLWSVFDYTVARLPAETRDALAGLTVFRGGFDLSAAQEVAGADLDTLLTLMNRTLVRRSEEGRFTLHPLVRQYLLMDGSRVRHPEHARYFTALLQRLTPDLKGEDPVSAVDRIEKDQANVEAAWEYATHNADAQLLDAARDALDYYYHYRSQWIAAGHSFSRAVEALESAALEPVESRVLGRLHVHLSQYLRAQGDVLAAERHARNGRELLGRYGTEHDVAYARLEEGSNAAADSRYDASRAALESVLEQAVRHGDHYLEGAAHNGIANAICAADGDLGTAMGHYRASLAAHTRIGNLEGINGALINLGACSYDLAEYAEARRLWQEALAIAHRLGYVQREAVLHNNLGSLAESEGDSLSAADHYERSLRLRREIGDRRGVASVLHNLGRLQVSRGEHSAGLAHLRESLTMYDALGNREGGAHSRLTLAKSLVELGRLREADRHAVEALRLATKAESRLELLGALVARAEIREGLGEPEQALQLALFVAAHAGEREALLAKRAQDLIDRMGEAVTADANEEVPSSALDCDIREVARRELQAAGS